MHRLQRAHPAAEDLEKALEESANLILSGVTVRYLKIIEKSGYQALPWVRYITQSGEYEIRMN